MDTKAVRVFYRKATETIVWTHELRGTGVFPTTMEQDIAELPSKVLSREEDADGNILSEVLLGGMKEDYTGIEETDPILAIAILETRKGRSN